MKNRFRLIYFVIAVFTLCVSTAFAAEPELRNADLSGEGIPEGWGVHSYLQEGYGISASDGIVTLSSQDYNDLRLTQSVEVEPGTAYIFSAEAAVQGVSGGRGANLSIDNYNLDGSYIYTNGLSGSSDWQPLKLVFYTSPDQALIQVALRLGGYSELSRGSAMFRNVSLRVAAEGAENAVPLLAGASVSQSGGSESDGMTEARKIQLKSYLHLFVVVSVALGAFFLFGVYRNRDRLTGIDFSAKARNRAFVLAVLAGLALRSVLCSLWGGHDTDMSCWTGWGSYIAQNGCADFYTAPGHEWYDYPPAYMLVLGFLSRLLQLLQVPYGSDAYVFAFMLPAYLADILTALLLMHIANEQDFTPSWQLLLGLLVLFQPAAVVLSGAWGQIDSILTLLLLLTFVLLQKKRPVLAGAVYGLAVMTKWQALIYGPVLAAAYLLHISTKKDVLKTVLAVLSAFAVILLVSFPFKGSQGYFWVVGRFLNAAGGYDYASVEAYNFQALLGGNWTAAAKELLPGITYKRIGLFAIALAVVSALLYQGREAVLVPRRTQWEESPATLYLASSFCMYAVFTFGHYMHERYVFPVILLLLFAFVYTRRGGFLFSALLLSVVLFLNEVTAMFVVSQMAMSAVRSTPEHQAVVRICSLAETASFFVFMKFLAESLEPLEREGRRHA